MADETEIEADDGDDAELSVQEIVAYHLRDQYEIMSLLHCDGSISLVFDDLGVCIGTDDSLAGEIDGFLRNWHDSKRTAEDRAQLTELRDVLAMQLAKIEAALEPKRH